MSQQAQGCQPKTHMCVLDESQLEFWIFIRGPLDCMRRSGQEVRYAFMVRNRAKHWTICLPQPARHHAPPRPATPPRHAPHAPSQLKLTLPYFLNRRFDFLLHGKAGEAFSGLGRMSLVPAMALVMVLLPMRTVSAACATPASPLT